MMHKLYTFLWALAGLQLLQPPEAPATRDEVLAQLG